MSPIPRRPPDFLDTQVRIKWTGGQRWRSPDGARIWTWDSLHGEIEGFTRRGYHVGVFDPKTGARIGEAIPGRRIDV